MYCFVVSELVSEPVPLWSHKICKLDTDTEVKVFMVVDIVFNCIVSDSYSKSKRS